MQGPHCCPLCNDFSVVTTLQHYEVTAKVRGEDRDVTGLAAFTCRRGHIFFLRRSDLIEIAESQPAGTSLKRRMAAEG